MSRSETKSAGRRAAPDASARSDAGVLPHTLQQPLEAVADAQNKLLEQARRHIAVREAERAAIARELHDKFGQYLTVMEMELDAISKGNEITPVLRARLSKMKDLTISAYGDMNNMARGIHPNSLQGQSLSDACERLAQDWSERSRLSFDLHLSLGACALESSVADTIYRVLQEAVINVVKHANASRVGVILRSSRHEVVLAVEDDGEGFELQMDADQISLPQLGISGMRERLDLVGGTLEIETNPGRGTTLLIRVPL